MAEDSIYYDDENHTKDPNPIKPTEEEVEHYKKSVMIRKAVLRKASGFSATSNFLAGEGYKNMEYHYAWFEIIFKDDSSELLSACNTTPPLYKTL